MQKLILTLLIIQSFVYGASYKCNWYYNSSYGSKVGTVTVSNVSSADVAKKYVEKELSKEYGYRVRAVCHYK